MASVTLSCGHTVWLQQEVRPGEEVPCPKCEPRKAGRRAVELQDWFEQSVSGGGLLNATVNEGSSLGSGQFATDATDPVAEQRGRETHLYELLLEQGRQNRETTRMLADFVGELRRSRGRLGGGSRVDRLLDTTGEEVDEDLDEEEDDEMTEEEAREVLRRARRRRSRRGRR